VVEQVIASSGEDTNPVRVLVTARSQALVRARTLTPGRERATRASATSKCSIDDNDRRAADKRVQGARASGWETTIWFGHYRASTGQEKRQTQ
jgi:hypothetical protein